MYSKYEIARIIAARALQLSMNAPILIKISKEELEKINYDVIKIAEMEFNAGVLPITVKRPLPPKIHPERFRKLVEGIEERKEEEISEETIEEMMENVEMEEKEEEEIKAEEEGIEE
jgi:DNA-directed RNA polymerase subunit K